MVVSNKILDDRLRAQDEGALLHRVELIGEARFARNTVEERPANALVPWLQRTWLAPSHEVVATHVVEGRLRWRARESREGKEVAFAKVDRVVDHKASRFRSLTRLYKGLNPQCVVRDLNCGADNLAWNRTDRGVDSALEVGDDYTPRRLGVTVAELSRNASMLGARGDSEEAGRHVGDEDAIWREHCAQSAQELLALPRGDGVEDVDRKDSVEPILRSSRQTTNTCAEAWISSQGA